MLDDQEATDIAIIGMAGRFPGAATLDQFWQNLRDGVEAIQFPSDAELLARGLPPHLLADPHWVKAAAVLPDLDAFDAAFFGIPHREAELMDPQQRVFLECAHEALERAGYLAAPDQAIGVFAGGATNTYLLFNLATNPALLSAFDPVQIDIASAGDFLTTRVSYKLNLTGPSHLIQSACSTSLVAVHVACQSLLNDECDLALAGGVSINVSHPTGYRYLDGGIVSPDGHCRAFDAAAQGTIFSSGVGVVALKRLADARADRDTILAVILGSAVNNDGAAKVGYTAPSVRGQAAVIREALSAAGAGAASISYVEAHGTATALGDPIEVRALTQAYRTETAATGYCGLGTVKSNVGHLGGAAGVAGLIKTVLALQHRQIPPTLHFEAPNPQIAFADSPFYVNTELRAWTRGAGPRRAGVSSFGVGGTNAHVIVEEAPAAEPTDAGRPWQLLVVSAKSDAALSAATQNLADYLRADAAANLADVAYTLQVGRQAFDYRRALVCCDVDDAVRVLGMEEPQRVFDDVQSVADRPVAFMFPGQGAQYAGMGRGLYASEPVFRAAIDRCCDLLRPRLGLDLRELLYGADERRTTNDERPRLDKGAPSSLVLGPSSEPGTGLEQTWAAQPALFVIEYALAQLWLAWGVRPVALIGHSIGEYVAACLAGVFRLEDALDLVAARGRLMQDLPAGVMLSVPLPEAEIRPLLGSGLDLAAINGPAQCVVSGPAAAIAALERDLAAQGVEARTLHTSHAFHSAMMDPIREPFLAALRRITLSPPQIPYLSNLTGDWITPDQATDPAYWADHLRGTVRFGDGMRALLDAPDWALLEVGPGRTLSMLARGQEGAAGRIAVSSLPHPNDRQPDEAFVLTSLGKLWLAGVAIDWAGMYAGERRRRLPLPTYPFERRRYWIAPGTQPTESRAPALGKKADIADWFYLPAWKRALPPRPLRQGDLAGDQRSWLAFVDAGGMGAALVRRLRRERRDVTSVLIGERFSKVEETVYTIDPRQPDDYSALIDELRTLDKIPGVIVHTWSLTTSAQPGSGPFFFEQAQDAGFYSLLYLAQALGKHEIGEPLRIEVITNAALDVTGDELTEPEKAPLLGVCAVIPQEYLNIGCRCIDIVAPPPDSWQAERLLDYLLADIVAAPPESVAAYRGNQRWVRSYEPARLADGAPIRSLRERGVYMITGGLAEIGFAQAECIAQTVRARLALIEDASFPPVAEWEGWIESHDAYDAVSRKIRNVRALQALDADVLVIGADVAAPDQMQAAVAQAIAQYGAIHGVIHAAGVAGEKSFRTIEETDFSECRWHFRPKAHGLYALDQALQGQPLDFCLLDSSLASVLGGMGYAAYAAANMFMDAFAHNHNKISPVPWISVNWDAWQLQEDQAQITDISAELAQLAITPHEGRAAFLRILSLCTADQIIVSTEALPARIDELALKVASLRDQAQPPEDGAPSSLHPRPRIQTAFVAPSSAVERTIAAIWQQVLGVEQVGIHDDFFELGGHSLLITQLLNKLRKTYPVEIPMRSLFEHPTVAGMAALVVGASAQAGDDRPIAERLRDPATIDRQAAVEEYLRKKIAHALNVEVAQIPADGSLAAADLAAIGPDIQWNLKHDFDLQVYPHEIPQLTSIPLIAQFTLAELDRLAALKQVDSTPQESIYDQYAVKLASELSLRRPALTSGAKNPGMAFLHSSPRSGSTLLRVMLAGHPDLFCPPELDILPFDRMGEWGRGLADARYGHGFQWIAEGLQWAFMQLMDLDSEQGKAQIDQLIAQDLPVQEVYARLQRMAAPRLLVDKTPLYSMLLETLQRSEDLFDGAKYIFLTRHPYAMIESFLRIRLDKLFGPSMFGRDDVDPHVVAEKVWVACNSNILAFLRQVEPERSHLVRYEDLVNEPERVMRELCAFLGAPFDEATLRPYDDRRERMIGGRGDPNILQHEGIDARLGDAWRRIRLPRRLSAEAQQLAAELGYELPEPADPADLSLEQRLEEGQGDIDQIAALLQRVEQLSQEEVQAMLNQILGDQ